MSRSHRRLLSLLAVALLLVPLAGTRTAAEEMSFPEDAAPTEQVLIPAGEFIMGYKGDVESLASHRVRLDAFYIDTHEVTNAQYHAFCEATDRALPIFWGLDRFRCSLDYPDHPVVGVSHGDARAYAEWCGRRLPTEAEWEYAARGGLDQMQFDRGDGLLDTDANVKSSGYDATTPVGSFPANAYGLHDMVGNVREWVADYYSDDYFRNSPVDNPQGPEKTKWRVIKGGGWYSGKGCNRVHVRNALPGGWSDFNVGFRCAKDAK